MTDPKEELGQRFEDRRADSGDEESEKSSEDEGSDSMSQSDTTDNSDSTGTTNNSYNTSNSSNTGGSSGSGKPGPNPNPDSTRNRRQVPMYLPEAKADQLNNLYDRLDGQSKVAGDGGIEKHADFMEALVEFAIDHEDDLADRLEIKE
jgi:hypothetical protein